MMSLFLRTGQTDGQQPQESASRGWLGSLAEEEEEEEEKEEEGEETFSGDGEAPRQAEEEDVCAADEAPVSMSGALAHVVLRWTVINEVPPVVSKPSAYVSRNAPPTTIGGQGAVVGEQIDMGQQANRVCIADATLSRNHATFFVQSAQKGGCEVQQPEVGRQPGGAAEVGCPSCCYFQNLVPNALWPAAVRLRPSQKWYLYTGACFSVGASVLRVPFLPPPGGGSEEKGEQDQASLRLEVVSGPLKGDTVDIDCHGGDIGRSKGSKVCIRDKELSRCHCRIGYEDKSERFFLVDEGSVNGTFMQLVGPYKGARAVRLGDALMVGRTGLRVDRFDWGAVERIGKRPTMEDATVVVQDLHVPGLGGILWPQTFAAVFDGHRGKEASAFASKHLHRNLYSALLRQRERLSECSANPRELDAEIESLLAQVFQETDEAFLQSSQAPQAGCTGTVCLILGEPPRIYVANSGDSRTVVCQRGKVLLESMDHKPTVATEKERVERAGGWVQAGRVCGILSVSRAFGDCDFKSEGDKGVAHGRRAVKKQPQPKRTEPMTPTAPASPFRAPLTWGKSFAGIGRRKSSLASQDSSSSSVSTTPDDSPTADSQHIICVNPDVSVTALSTNFIILSCDGLFDVFSSAEVVQFVWQDLASHGDPQLCVERISHMAINDRGSTDNVSCVLLITDAWW